MKVASLLLPYFMGIRSLQKSKKYNNESDSTVTLGLLSVVITVMWLICKDISESSNAKHRFLVYEVHRPKPLDHELLKTKNMPNAGTKTETSLHLIKTFICHYIKILTYKDRLKRTDKGFHIPNKKEDTVASSVTDHWDKDHSDYSYRQSLLFYLQIPIQSFVYNVLSRLLAVWHNGLNDKALFNPLVSGSLDLLQYVLGGKWVGGK